MTRRQQGLVAVALVVLAAVLAVLAIEATRVSTPQPLAAPSASASSAPGDEQPSIAAGGDASPSAPTGAVAVEPGPQALPERLSVPAIGVETELEQLDLLPDGALGTPVDTDLAGWFEGGPRPGAVGPAVIAGHVSWNGDPSVFFRLTEIEPGDRIDVHQADGATVTFEVTRIEQHPKDDFPTVAVYANTSGPELRLITCGGEFDSSTGHFDDNVVVFAQIIEA
ncbi:class F sortase [Demequina sp. NBRC 110056]|uniref:class F sortase n=1 Tax=Demequina sp. NBRC 110056 TaxID=1570345 RepID=UPI000A024BBE|nr:class F sortase [Demequina sp. NBRC 110056]